MTAVSTAVLDASVLVRSVIEPRGEGAAWVAATHRSAARCGLFTHVLYEPDPFLERIRSEGMRLVPPEGTGVGFDDLLEAIPWKTLL